MDEEALVAIERLAKISSCLRTIEGGNVVIVGDLVIDHYVYGTVSGLDTNAPVAAMTAESVVHSLGASGHIARALVRIGLQPSFHTAIGDDWTGRRALELAAADELDSKNMQIIEGRHTSQISRYIARRRIDLADRQLVFRLERNDENPIPETEQTAIIEAALTALDTADALVISDYDRGVITDELTSKLLAAARKRGVPSIVDPKLIRLTPLHEAGVVIFEQRGLEIMRRRREAQSTDAVVEELLTTHEWTAILELLGPKGVRLHRRNQPAFSVDSDAGPALQWLGLHDAAALALVLGAIGGLDLEESAILTNAACELILRAQGEEQVVLNLERLIDRLDEMAWSLRISQR